MQCFLKYLDRNEQKKFSNSVTELLKEVYENEFKLNSYEFEGSMNLGLILPEFDGDEPEVAILLEIY